jgi:hypothetical protein
MNKEQQELLDEAYENYITKTRIEFETWRERNPDALVDYGEDTKELFLKSIKDNKHWFSGEKNFSEKWRLQIEERELSLEERYDLVETDKHIQFVQWQSLGTDRIKEVLDKKNVPTRLITVTYNDKTIESYE